MSLTGVFGEIIGIVIGLYVAYAIPSWRIPIIIIDAYQVYLPISVISIVLSGCLKILMHISPWYPLKKLFEALAILVGMWALYMLTFIFPLEFGAIGRPEINGIVRFALYIALIGTGIGFISTCFQMLKGVFKICSK